jgi:hypothetical protein
MMDETAKAVIRKRARTLHRIMQTVLAVAMVSALYVAVMTRADNRLRSEEPLFDASQKLNLVNLRHLDEQTRRLCEFAPPADSTALSDWAHRVRDHMDFPVAVFTKTDSMIHWLSVPPDYLRACGAAAELLDGSRAAGERARADTVGMFVRWLGATRHDTAAAMLVAYTPSQNGTGWGILYYPVLSFQSVFASLERCRTSPHSERVAEDLMDVLQVQQVPEMQTTRVGLRALEGDELLYETPGLDTTHERQIERYGSLSLEFYAPDQVPRPWDHRVNATLAAVLCFVMMATLWAFYGWLCQLCEPEQTDTHE